MSGRSRERRGSRHAGHPLDLGGEPSDELRIDAGQGGEGADLRPGDRVHVGELRRDVVEHEHPVHAAVRRRSGDLIGGVGLEHSEHVGQP
jgi:hypothetical protein